VHALDKSPLGNCVATAFVTHWVATGELIDPRLFHLTMGRSKNIHIVQLEVDVTQPSTDPSMGNWAEGSIQVDKELSKELGRTIRNGNSFRLIGFGANLRAVTGGSDLDVGFAGTAVVQYCPVTKNGVGAWQSLQKQWMKQKSLSSGVGKYVRYDDFEVGWDATTLLTPQRNSNILMGGLNDAASEDIGIYGTSVDGTYVSLSSYYNNMNPIPEPSEDPFGSVIKTPKFTDKFPDWRNLVMPCTFSAALDASDIGEYYFGAIATGDINWLPSDNHLSHMTGTLRYYFKGLAPDTDIPPADPDELKLIITLVYEGWAPLAKVRSARAITRNQLTTAASGKTTTRSRRRS